MRKRCSLLQTARSRQNPVHFVCRGGKLTSSGVLHKIQFIKSSAWDRCYKKNSAKDVSVARGCTVYSSRTFWRRNFWRTCSGSIHWRLARQYPKCTKNVVRMWKWSTSSKKKTALCADFSHAPATAPSGATSLKNSNWQRNFTYTTSTAKFWEKGESHADPYVKFRLLYSWALSPQISFAMLNKWMQIFQIWLWVLPQMLFESHSWLGISFSKI